MSVQLRRYLIDEYESRRSNSDLRRFDSRFPIQIDDQDDNDNLTEFCNLFCFVNKKDTFTLEISGKFPITSAMKDLAEIYGGLIDLDAGRFSILLKVTQIEAIMDLADKIRKTALNDSQLQTNSWLAISARTISSLYRFVRIIKEYTHSQSYKQS